MAFLWPHLNVPFQVTKRRKISATTRLLMASSRTDSMLDLRLSTAELQQRRRRILEFLETMRETAEADGAVIGLSGGIDSTTTAYLATEALGTDALNGFVMPASVSEADNMSDAEEVALELGIDYEVVPIHPFVEQFLSAIPEAEGNREAIGNLRARSRAVLTYLVANVDNRIVLGTGNRSETLTGYYTKFGDQAVDCNPIGNLYKTQVRQLARHLGVSESIISKPPTAGLWEGQTDEKELGIDYETLDAVLALHIDGPLSVAATARELEMEEVVVEDVRMMYETTSHKRRMPPAPGDH